jgi:hypothetical protein
MSKSSLWDLDSALSRKSAQKHFGRKLDILKPLICFSHEFLHDCRSAGTHEIDLAVALAFRQCLEFADAVDVLLRHLIIAPAMAQARSALETAPQVILLAKRRDPVLAAAYIINGLYQAQLEVERKLKASDLDDEDTGLLQLALVDMQAVHEQYASDHAGQLALAALKTLGPGAPWYAIRNGPKNIHRLFDEVGAGKLSNFYRDLNPAVHGGLPLLGTGAASGDQSDAEYLQPIRPLRMPSPWSFRPLLTTAASVVLTLMTVVVYFVPHLPHWAPRYAAFREEHNRRCQAAELPSLCL